MRARRSAISAPSPPFERYQSELGVPEELVIPQRGDEFESADPQMAGGYPGEHRAT